MNKPSKKQTDFGMDSEPARKPVPFTQDPGRPGGFDLGSISQWQRERAMRLHRICQFIQARVVKGQSLNKACQRFSKRWNGKSLRSDPTRRYALNVSSLHRHFRRWELGGEMAAVFRLR